jgi:hypothetical protein
MAKVTGPAHSLRASGTLADLITFDKRGIAHAPNSPGNQGSAERGNARQIFLSMSRALQRCQASVKTAIEAAAHPNRDWRAWTIKRAIGEQRSAWISTGLMWATFTEGERTAWDEAASAAGFTATAIAYATDDPITTGLAMFELASTLYTPGIITGPGEPAADNASEWATAITGYEPPAPGYVSLWSLTDTPAVIDTEDPTAYELGVLFHSDVAGSIVGFRFYKAAANAGAHIGRLWDLSQTKLGEVNFTDETESGWQTAILETPIAITAGTHYVASYVCPAGHHSESANYFTAAHDNDPLHAPTDYGGYNNGLYTWTLNTMPNQTYEDTNYWVDVLFQE